MKIHLMDQRSDEWFEIRRGRMTGSNAQAIAANGKGLETYILSVLAGKYSKNTEKYSNGDMERGVELEESARLVYQIETGSTVEEVGFIEMDEYAGVSPDGLVGEDGGIEIKCPCDNVYIKLLLDQKIDSKYFYQMQMFLLVSGRKWIDYVAYNPNFDKALTVIRVFPDMASQEKLTMGIEKGKRLLIDLEEKYAEAIQQI